MQLIPRNGDANAADHAALSPYKSSAWTTAVAIVRERVQGARITLLNDPYCPKCMGRYEMARDILVEMEERK